MKALAPIILLLLPLTTFAQNTRYAGLDSLMVNMSDTAGSSALLLVNNRQILYNFLSTRKGGFRIDKEMPIGSASQWLTAATLLALQDKDVLSLDDRIDEYLDDVPPSMADITITQLLTHTSGLPARSSYVDDAELSLQASVDQVLDNLSLQRTPGQVFNYGTVSYQLAGRIAEKATNKAWQDIFYNEIAKPCDMTNTSFDKERAPYIAKGAVSTPADYINFLMMVLNDGRFQGKQVLQQSSVHQMLKDRTSDLPILANADHRQTAERANYYGLGVWIDKIEAGSGITIEVSNAGTGAFLPWLNDCEGVGGVFASRSRFSDIHQSLQPLKNEVDQIFTDSCKVAITRKQTPPTVRPNKNVRNPLEEKASSQKMIRFELDEAATVNLKLYDSLGNEVGELIDKRLEAGEYAIPVSKDKYNPGIYLYRLVIDEQTKTMKLTLKE
jgi:CubicO group peptidase (beta-lactamase class C family)